MINRVDKVITIKIKEAGNMPGKDITSMRGTIDFLMEQGEVLAVKGEVDPIYEISGSEKAFENGPVWRFENIKGYPGVRDVGNVFSREERVAGIFDVASAKELKFKCLEALKNPITARLVEEAPCQEVVITEDIDVSTILPIIKHTEEDAGRILGGGNTFVSGHHFRNGTHLSFNRMHFRGKDWASIAFVLSTHLEWVALEHRGAKIPVTINIATPPAVCLVAGGGMVHAVIPVGTDELAIAGGLQGCPVDICRAKTVDAYAIANSEWVIEGYIDTTQTVWESEECERVGDNVAPFFPEYTGYMGRARRTYKFQTTAITHRRDRPIFYTPLAHSFECTFLCKCLREACFYEVADRLVPGLVTDVNILTGHKSWGGIVFQVRKRRGRDEGYQKNILAAAFGASPGLRWAIAVDEDVDIYSSDDVIFAMTTRLNPTTGIIRGGGERGLDSFPSEKGESVAKSVYEGGIGFDATVPLESKWRFQRPSHPVDRIDLRKWFSEEDIAAARALQCEYARVLADTGW